MVFVKKHMNTMILREQENGAVISVNKKHNIKNILIGGKTDWKMESLGCMTFHIIFVGIYLSNLIQNVANAIGVKLIQQLKKYPFMLSI